MDIGRIKTLIQWVFAGIAGLWRAIPSLTQLLLVFMALDILFGVAVAIRQKNVSSGEVWRGATKKLATLGLVVAAAFIQPHVGTSMGINLVQTVSAFYLVGELTSVTRNAVLLGVLIPPQFQTALGYFEGFSSKREGPKEG